MEQATGVPGDETSRHTAFQEVSMIELLPNLPDKVIGFLASGEVTAQDYESVLIPAVELKIKECGAVRLLYHIGPAFARFTAAAMWDDAKVGMTHLKAWEKIAVVTDIDWISGAISMLRFAMPCPVKVFSNRQYAEAVDWIGMDVAA
jgi:hypothetical protein